MRCEYNVNPTTGYTCNLFLKNPNGFDDFTAVDGNHLIGRSNADVVAISSGSVSSTNFPSVISRQFVNLRQISMTNGGFTRLDANSFSSSRNLQIINFSNNTISQIDENAFRQNSQLTSLILESNQLNILSNNLFDSLINLRTLNLGNNKLKTLPAGIFNRLTNLTSLNLAFGEFKTVGTNWFDNLSRLTELHLIFCQIEDISYDVFTPLINLQFLYLQFNNLKALHSDSFSSLPNLHTLHAQFNKINGFDERIIDLTGIRTLFMDFNPCVNFGGSVVNDTKNRAGIREMMKKCIENYQERSFLTTTNPGVLTTTPGVGCKHYLSGFLIILVGVNFIV